MQWRTPSRRSLTAIAAQSAAPLCLLLVLASTASAITSEEQATLLKWDNEPGPKRPHRDALALANKLAVAGDLSAVDMLLKEKRRQLASDLVTAYFGKRPEMPAVSADFEALLLAYRSDPETSRMLLDKWARQRPAAKYVSPALFEVLLRDLQGNDRSSGLPYLAAHVILSTDVRNAEERVLQVLARLPLPAAESMVLGSAPVPSHMQPSAVGVQGWALLMQRFAEHKYLAALPAMKAWQAERPAGDKLAATIDRTFVIYERPEAIAALRDRMSYLSTTTDSVGARWEFDSIGEAFARLDRNVPTPFEQVRDLVPSALLESSERSWRELRRRTGAAHVLILKVVAHYRSLDSYADSGTIASNTYGSGQFETRFARGGRYMTAWHNKDGAREINWGHPGCNNRSLALGGTISTKDCEAGDKLPVTELQSPVLSVLGEGLDWFYKTDHLYAVESLDGDAKNRVRLKGTRPDQPEQYRAYVIDPATGAIDSAESFVTGGFHRSYELIGRDNIFIPFWEFWPWRGLLMQFAPWRFTLRGMIGAFVYPLLLGLLYSWLIVRASTLSIDVQRQHKRRVMLGLAVAMGLLGLSALGFFALNRAPLSLGPALLLAVTMSWVILILVAAVGFCFGMFCLETLRRRVPQPAGGSSAQSDAIQTH